jgi:hypothetical protein
MHLQSISYISAFIRVVVLLAILLPPFPLLPAAQCGHAVYGLTKKLRKKHLALLQQWEACGQPKIALKGDGGVSQLVTHVQNSMSSFILHGTQALCLDSAIQ